MSTKELLDFTAIALGAALMAISIRRAWGMRFAVQQAGFCGLLKLLMALQCFFLLGYLLSLYAIATHHLSALHTVIGQVLLFGSVFVLLTIHLANRTSQMLMEHSQNLEKLVAERTEHLNEALRQQARTERYLRQLFEEMPVACFTYDADGVIREWNEEAERLYGFTAQEAIGKTIYELICRPEDYEVTAEVIRRVFSGESVRQIEWEDVTKDGQRRWVLCNTFPLNDGQIVRAISANMDITARKEQEAIIETQRDELEAQTESLQQLMQRLAEANGALERMAVTDAMTGLPNHRVFRERLWREFLWSLEHDRCLSVIMLDIDRFKRFNDNFGHQAGDEVLRLIARVLLQSCGDQYLAARYGGEEFSVILPEHDAQKAIQFAEQLRESIASTPCCYQPITASLGVATLSLHTLNPETLVEEADQALYAAKRGGRNRVCHAATEGIRVDTIPLAEWQERVQKAIAYQEGYAVQQVLSQLMCDHLQILRRVKAAVVLGQASVSVKHEVMRFESWMEHASGYPIPNGPSIWHIVDLHQRFMSLVDQAVQQPQSVSLDELRDCSQQFISALHNILAVVRQAA